ARALSLGPKGLLAVSCRYNETTRRANVELWNAATQQHLDTVTTALLNANRCCAISPDGTRLATHDGDEDAVLLFRLRDGKGRLLPKPLSGRQPLRLRGRGRSVWHVAFENDAHSHRIGFGTERAFHEIKARAFNNYGSVREAFDLAAPKHFPTAPEGVRWKSPQDHAGGWRVERGETDSEFVVRHADGTTGKVALLRSKQGLLSCYCWIPGPDGRPAALAIGTAEGFGVYVYGLPAGGRCELLRYFRDHQGHVASVSVSADGRFLASASQDQTIKIWSLEGLHEPPGPFPKSRAWGAAFSLQDGRATVETALEAGIAFGRGLRPGDVITLARFFHEDQMLQTA
ncbi:MAG: WD40 repeat domain-containing protein, partial [Planctomycetaceae bacterium]